MTAAVAAAATALPAALTAAALVLLTSSWEIECWIQEQRSQKQATINSQHRTVKSLYSREIFLLILQVFHLIAIRLRTVLFCLVDASLPVCWWRQSREWIFEMKKTRIPFVEKQGFSYVVFVSLRRNDSFARSRTQTRRTSRTKICLSRFRFRLRVETA